MKERVYVKKDSGWLDVGDFDPPPKGGATPTDWCGANSPAPVAT